MPVSSHHKSDIEIKEELQLIEAAKENSARFGLLYDKYYKSIFVFIYRRTDDEELTADITSQVFLKALINIKKYEYKGVPFSAWLFRIAFNEINMYFRKNNAQRVVSLNQYAMVQIAQEAELEENAEGIKQMMIAVKQLDALELQLIELRFFEMRQFKEIGEILNITEANAKMKLYRILDKLKPILEKKMVIGE